MKKFILLLAFTALNAQANYQCSKVGGIEEWTIYIDLKNKLAGFFDNDTTVVVPLVKTGQLEILDPITFYYFEGEDTNSENNSRLGISFNLDALSAAVVLESQHGKTPLQALDKCKFNDRINLKR